MKLWEVLKELEENREKKYKMISTFWKIHEIGLDDNGYYTFSTIYNGKNIDAEPGGWFGGNIYQEADWQEVKQPVTWQEAIEAWVNGKTVKCVDDEGKAWTYKQKWLVASEDDNALALNEIKYGTWYIED